MDSTTPYLKQYTKAKMPGRPMKLGRPVINPITGEVGVYAGRCDCGCNAKVILPRADVLELARQYVKAERCFIIRFAARLLRVRFAVRD